MTALDWNMRGLLKGKKDVLDLGCGFLKWEAACGRDARYTGWDVSIPDPTQWPRTAAERHKRGLLHLYEANFLDRFLAADHPLKVAPDAILLMDVIEHLERTDGEHLVSIMAHLYPKAMIAIFTPEGLTVNGEHTAADDPQTHRSGWEMDDFPSFMKVHFPAFHENGDSAILMVKR